eukprot:jgi/Chrzof1/2085/Cz11g02070.t1
MGFSRVRRCGRLGRGAPHAPSNTAALCAFVVQQRATIPSVWPWLVRSSVISTAIQTSQSFETYSAKFSSQVWQGPDTPSTSRPTLGNYNKWLADWGK